MNGFMLKSFFAFVLLALFEVRADCFTQAGRYYSIDPDYLRAIAYRESKFNNAAFNHNKDKNGKILSTDYCMMQVNTRTLTNLAREYPRLSVNKIRNNQCLCVHIGALVLRRNFNKYGPGWLAVGMYNAGMANKNKTIRNRYNYAMRINSAYKDIKAKKIPVPIVN